MGTVIRHGDKWRGFAEGPRGADGARTRRSRVFRTEREAKAWVRAEEAARDRGEAVAPDRRTLAALAADWLEARAGGLRPKTLASYRGSLERHVLPRLGHLRVQALTEQDVARWVAALRRDGVGARSVHLAKLRLDQVLDLAVDWNLAPRNAARRVAVPAPAPARAAVWTLDELRRFLAAAEAEPSFPLWHVAAATGLRRGELLGLRWADLDLDAAELRVAQQVVPVPGGLAVGPPKSASAARVVALPAWLPPLLRAHRDRQAFARAAAGEAWQDWGLVFPSRVGTPQNPANLYPDLYRLMARAGVPRITWHQIRHTHVTHAIAAGVPVGVVSKRVGHARTSITTDIYSHVLAGQDRAAADVIGGLLAPDPREGAGS